MNRGFTTEEVWQPNGRGFSMGIAAGEGRVVHLTGQVAWDRNERIVGPGDPEEQTRQAFRNIKALLESIGGRMSDIVQITTYYLDPAHLPLIQKVRLDFLDSQTPPASTSVMVARLGHPDFLVELTPVAVIPEDRLVES